MFTARSRSCFLNSKGVSAYRLGTEICIFLFLGCFLKSGDVIANVNLVKKDDIESLSDKCDSINKMLKEAWVRYIFFRDLKG